MDAMEAILTRRSIRKYTSEPIPDELIELLLKAAMAAPTASNKQPWHFVVVRDRALLDQVPDCHPDADMVKEATLAILVCGDSEIQGMLGYQAVDCSAVTENILLAAHASGLGAVWLGIFPREERIIRFKELFGLPEHITPISMISIGYPAEHKSPPDRFKLERVRYEQW